MRPYGKGWSGYACGWISSPRVAHVTPTALPTAYTTSVASGHGLTSAWTFSTAVAPLSQAPQSPAGRIIGIQSCRGRIAALASVVTMVKVAFPRGRPDTSGTPTSSPARRTRPRPGGCGTVAFHRRSAVTRKNVRMHDAAPGAKRRPK